MTNTFISKPSTSPRKSVGRKEFPLEVTAVDPEVSAK
jgi:hypothetical protein